MPSEESFYAVPETIVEAVEIVEATAVDDEPARPWGFWATVGFSLAVLSTFVALQTAVAIPFAIVELKRSPHMPSEELAEHLESNGLLLSLATLVSAPVGVALTVLFARLRKRMTLSDYLGLRPVSKITLALGCLSVVLFALGSDWLTDAFAREIAPSPLIRAYQTAGFLPLLWLALLAGAPLFEEVFFRGFLFRGIEASRLGGAAAILITSLLWAAIHMQYDAYRISIVFAGGLLLGLARLKTGSVYVTVAMHVVWNFIALVEVALIAG